MFVIGGGIGEEEDEEMAGRRRRHVAVVDLRVRRSAAMASFGSPNNSGGYSMCLCEFCWCWKWAVASRFNMPY